MGCILPSAELLYKVLGKWQGKGQEKFISEVTRSRVSSPEELQIGSSDKPFVFHWHTLGTNAYQALANVQQVGKTGAQQWHQHF